MLKHVLFLLNNAGIRVPSLIQGTLCWESHVQPGGGGTTFMCVTPGQDAVAVNCVCVLTTTGVSTASLSQWVGVCRY